MTNFNCVFSLKLSRIFKGQRRELGNPQKNILDGDLLFEYFNMSYTERHDIAKKIKTNNEQVFKQSD